MSVLSEYLHAGPAVLIADGREVEVTALVTMQDYHHDGDGREVWRWGGLAYAPPDLDGEPTALRLPTGEERPLTGVTVRRRADAGDVLVTFAPPKRPTEYAGRGTITV